MCVPVDVTNEIRNLMHSDDEYTKHQDLQWMNCFVDSFACLSSLVCLLVWLSLCCINGIMSVIKISSKCGQVFTFVIGLFILVIAVVIVIVLFVFILSTYKLQ